MDYISVITAHTLIRANRIASTPIPKNNKLRKWLPPPVISFKVSVTSAGFFWIIISRTFFSNRILICRTSQAGMIFILLPIYRIFVDRSIRGNRNSAFWTLFVGIGFFPFIFFDFDYTQSSTSGVTLLIFLIFFRCIVP